MKIYKISYDERVLEIHGSFYPQERLSESRWGYIYDENGFILCRSSLHEALLVFNFTF